MSHGASGVSRDRLTAALEATVRKHSRQLEGSLVSVCAKHCHDLALALRRQLDEELRLQAPLPVVDEHAQPMQHIPTEEPQLGAHRTRCSTGPETVGWGASIRGSSRSNGKPKRTSVREGGWHTAFVDSYTKAGTAVAERLSHVFSEEQASKFASLWSLAVGATRPVAAARQWIGALVLSQTFTTLCGIMIMANSLLMGFEIEYMAHHFDTNPTFVSIQTGLNVWYTVELFLRVVYHGRTFFTAGQGEWRWNVMDLALVSTSMVDLVLTSESSELKGVKLSFMLRTVRLMRMLRTLRIFRSLRVFGTFRKMVFALSTSMHTLFWSFFLLGLVIYTFAIWFTAAVSDCMLERVGGCQIHDEQKVRDLHHKFGTVASSMFTLYQSIAEGHHWSYAAELLMEIDPWMLVLFLFYIQLAIFGVLNIVEAVFVESAILSTSRCKELLMEEKMEEKENLISQMRDIFKVMDMDGSGSVSLEELTEFLSDEALQLDSYLEALDLNANDTNTLFKLLDWDDSGAIDIDEFCDGCMRLKGEARSFDINCLLYNVRSLSKCVSKIKTRCDTMFEIIGTRALDTDKAVLQARV